MSSQFLYFLVIFLCFYDFIIISAELNTMDYMSCGGLSTAITDVLLYPIDTIKVRQQSSRIRLTLSQVFKDIMKTNGPIGLYKGVVSYAGIDGCGAAIFFTVYEGVKNQFTKTFNSPLIPYVSASAAFVVSSTFMVPAELIKVKMQSQSFPSVASCIKTLWKQDGLGIRGLYSGYSATLTRDLPYFALQLGCFG